jgi:hypothetical protein
LPHYVIVLLVFYLSGHVLPLITSTLFGLFSLSYSYSFSLLLCCRDLFQYERIEPYLHMKNGYEQLFVGREGTGTPFHNAANWNMFYMVRYQMVCTV